MKIYPSKHRIKQVMESNIDRDITIPLAHIDNSHATYSITRSVHRDFSTTSKTVVLPNQLLENEDVILFDEFGNPAQPDTIINKTDKGYCYYPNNMIEFLPLKFSYNVIAQKKVTYTASGNFNINIACIDDTEKMDFTNKMSKILIAPSENNYLPSNIAINNNDTTIGRLNQIDYDNTNFVFIESPDGLHYNFEFIDETGQASTSTSNKTTISLETFLSHNINTWIICDEHYKYPITHGTGGTVLLKQPRITTKRDMYVKDYYNSSDLAFRTFKVHNLFENDVCPILILEHENRGFTIYSSSEIFNEDKIDSYKNIIYEVLMYVHCISYKQSKTISEYITYDIPDYEIINNSLYKKNSFVSKTSLNSILGISAGHYEVRLVNVIDDSTTVPRPNDLEDLSSAVDGIVCVGKSNGKLVFKLENKDRYTNIYQEPKKPNGWTSIFYNDKVYYLEQLHYLMETNLGKDQDQENKLFLIEKDVDLLVRLYPFRSSKYGLNIVKDLKITIPFIKTTLNDNKEVATVRVKNENYVLYLDRDTNDLNFVYEDEFEESFNKVYLALIIIKEVKSEQYLTDMRLKGGGLPEDMPDNFNLLDIGHIYGRPYRQANTLVITLPKKYEPYKNEILAVIDKYKVAEDYPILFFEDDKKDCEI